MYRMLITIACLFCVFTLSATATIIHVPSQYPTIQAGVNAASPGDTVLVAPGIYYENIQMREGVSLFGSGMDSTVIDGGGITDVVYAYQINNAVIEDFTIQNSQQGGSSPGNIGVFFNPQSSTGIKIVRNCIVRHNGHGVQVWNDFGGVAYVENNVITDNIYDGFDPYLGTTHLTNNTIVSNGRDGYHDWAGGGQVYIKNNIFAENGRYGIFKHRDTPVYISYNDVWANIGGDYLEGYSGPPVPFTPIPGTGEISANPLFADPPLDYHLTWANFPTPDSTRSPCIDAGDPALPLDPDSTRADMGAFYFDQWYPDISVTLLPYGAPIIIPDSGGWFEFSFMADYIQPAWVPFDGWMMIMDPDSVWTDPVMEFTLPAQNAGTFFEFDSLYTVQAGLDTGIYIFEARVGYFPDEVWDTDAFTFQIMDTTSNVPDYSVTMPMDFMLYPAYPNPFNPTTTLTFSVPTSTHVSLKIYDVTGRYVTTLVNGWQMAGSHEVLFDGNRYPSGIYFCQLSTGTFHDVTKMVLLK